MKVNFLNKQDQQNFKIFFVNKNKKNLNDYTISSDFGVKKNVLNSLSNRNFNGELGQICHIETLNTSNTSYNNIFIGIGENVELNDFNFQYIGGLLFSYFENLKYKKITFFVNKLKKVSVSYENIIYR